MKDKKQDIGVKQQTTEEQNMIELRSEKVRNLIGQMPPFLIRWGNTLLVIILLLLGVACWIAGKLLGD